MGAFEQQPNPSWGVLRLVWPEATAASLGCGLWWVVTQTSPTFAEEVAERAIWALVALVFANLGAMAKRMRWRHLG
jgi:hypothetical protein